MRRRLVSKPVFYGHVLAVAGLGLFAVVLLYLLVFQSTWSSDVGRELSFEGIRTDARITTVTPVASDGSVHLTLSWTMPNGQRQTGNATLEDVGENESGIVFGADLPIVYLAENPQTYALIRQRPVGGSILVALGSVSLIALIWLLLCLRRFKITPAQRVASLDFTPER